MNTSSENIFPVFDKIISKEKKEKLLNQKGKVVWLTGLSGSGKTTIALQLEKELFKLGFLVQILDGDNIRMGLNKDLGFSPEDRKENIRRISETAKLFADSGKIVLTAFISPYLDDRDKAKALIGKDFVEIFVDTSIKECIKRDPKGLYKKAHNGEILDFTGVSAPYECPTSPDLTIDTEKLSIEDSTTLLMHYVKRVFKM